MKTVLVRYKTHADKASENEALIHAVFDELRRTAPPGLQYGAFKLADGASFVHFATVDTADGTNPLTSLPSFKEFQRGIKDRCVEPPVAVDLVAVDSYGLFGKATS